MPDKVMGWLADVRKGMSCVIAEPTPFVTDISQQALSQVGYSNPLLRSLQKVRYAK